MSFLTSTDQGEAEFHFPKWLDTMLHKKFFEHCSHHAQTKNELNRYCIDCEIEGCRYCIAPGGDHDDHVVLQIYRHVHKDVITLTDIENHIDCSKIQPYKCNKKWIISLEPLPHCGSGSQIHKHLSCAVCKRKLMNPDHYRYCCISCKVEAFSKKIGEAEAPSLLNGNSSVDYKTKLAREEKRKRPRKGLPARAALPS